MRRLASTDAAEISDCGGRVNPRSARKRTIRVGFIGGVYSPFARARGKSGGGAKPGAHLSICAAVCALTRIFHTRRSRRREEADGRNGWTNPPPHVGGYGLWAFHSSYEISRLTLHLSPFPPRGEEGWGGHRGRWACH